MVRPALVAALLVLVGAPLALTGGDTLTGDDTPAGGDPPAGRGDTPALDRTALRDALREGDASSLARAILELRGGGTATEPLAWLSIAETAGDGTRRYPNAERLGRWLRAVDEALGTTPANDGEALAEAVVEACRSLSPAAVSERRLRDDRALLTDIAAGRAGLARTIDRLATRGVSASDLEVAIARGRRPVIDGEVR